ncbi:MAG TPA: hypothetical protein VMI31_10095 [Fimbriimonadaceae bacterium]|nr:hypothetical protein [Fimbriimonadaceae bacterium]
MRKGLLACLVLVAVAPLALLLVHGAIDSQVYVDQSRYIMAFDQFCGRLWLKDHRADGIQAQATAEMSRYWDGPDPARWETTAIARPEGSGLRVIVTFKKPRVRTFTTFMKRLDGW